MPSAAPLGGSFKVNPNLHSFDSRGLYAAKLDTLSDIERTIEDVITELCYNGEAFCKEAQQEEGKKHKKEKKSTTYQVWKEP